MSRCDFHQFEDCGICHRTGDLRDLLPGRTLYPGIRTETDLVAIEREFPNALTTLDWLAPSWYRACPEPRLIRYQAIGSEVWQIAAIAGRRSMRWDPRAQVWLACTRSVSSRGERRNHRRVGRRRDDRGEVRAYIELEGPPAPGETMPIALVRIRPWNPLTDEEIRAEVDAAMIKAGVLTPDEVRASRFAGGL